MGAGASSQRYSQAWANLCSIQSADTRARMLETMAQAPDYVAAAKAVGVYGPLLYWLAAHRRGEHAAWPSATAEQPAPAPAPAPPQAPSIAASRRQQLLTESAMAAGRRVAALPAAALPSVAAAQRQAAPQQQQQRQQQQRQRPAHRGRSSWRARRPRAAPWTTCTRRTTSWACPTRSP